VLGTGKKILQPDARTTVSRASSRTMAARVTNLPAIGPLCALVLVAGCSSFSPVTIARDLGSVGWFHADPQGQWQRIDDDSSCEAIASKVREGEVIVVVPGVHGDGEEVRDLLPVLAGRTSAVLLYRWVPWDERDAIAKRFALGISHLLDCVPWVDGRLLVVAHSAGGIVVGYGATRVAIPSRVRKGPALYVVTVAAPLAGMDDRPPNADGRSEATFILDFGTRIADYPVAPTAMAAVHLRTQYPGDTVMRPSATHVPNDPMVGSPGARQIERPATLTHDGAMHYVAEKIADGSWRGWFDEGRELLRSDLLEIRNQPERGPRVGRFEIDEHRAHQSDLLRW
jgi:hypothetical protein